MYTPNTYELNDKMFVDTLGLFTLRKIDTIEFVVPQQFRINNKLGPYRGNKVQLKRVYKKHYGDIIQIVKIIEQSDWSFAKKMTLEEFKKNSDEFYSIKTWSEAKIHSGEKLFDFLVKFNPFYFQKNKDWKKKYIDSSKIGDYFILTIQDEKGTLRVLNNQTCLIVATYNKGFKNGFLAIQLE